jgi:hypothetical protein
MTVINIQQLADLLAISKRSAYELTRTKVRDRMKHPVPMLKINGNTRFIREQVLEWVKQLQEAAA